MDDSKAWLGDTVITNGLNIYSETDFGGIDKQHLSRLPDSVFAAKYKEYSLTGSVKDKTPPSPPFKLAKIITSEKNMEISWMADADIESGISHFNIYRNGEIWKRHPEKGIFQTYSVNGDNPIPNIPSEMKKNFNMDEFDASNIFSISTVNNAEIESERTTIN